MKKRRVLLGILAIIAVVAIGFVIKNFASNMYDDLANSNVELTAEEKQIKERDDNPEGKYLVTDKYISGILPQTSVTDFIASFDKDEVKIYSNKDCTNEVTSGNIASGMFAKYEANGRIFEISVLGDINQSTISEEIVENDAAKILKGDSNLNEIECTRVIRGYLESDNWKITEEPEFKSADVTSNRKLEDSDIKSIVNYIVFGELDAPKFDKIDSPSLKVIKGIKNEDGSFEGEATVQLTQNAENGTNNKYKIYKYGETPDINDNTEYLEATDGEEIKLTEAGKYAIVAYTYGELENKSKSEIKVLEVKPGIYRLTLVAGDNITRVIGAGEYKIGSKVNISAVLKENEDGYEYSWGLWKSDDVEIIQNQADQNAEIIMPKGDVTLTAIANKNIIDYTINYNLNGGKVEVENPTTYTIETPTFTLNNPSKKGYKFLGWTGTGLEEPTTTVTIQSGTFGNSEYTANWEKLPPVTYQVEYYKENLTGTAYDIAETIEDTAEIGTTVTATIKNYTGFTFNEDESLNKLEGEIDEVGTLVLKVYYKRNTYTLELNKNEHIQSVSGAGTYKFEEQVNISAVLKSADGYIYSFDKWKSDNTELLADQTSREKEFTMPAGDLSLTAIGTKTPRTDTQYVIESYYQVNGIYPETATSSTTKYGTTDETAEIQEIDKYPSTSGYVFDETNENNVLSGTIAGNGSLVLKLYFKAQFSVTYKPGAHGTFAEQITSSLDYNSTTPSFVGELSHQPGYEFAGWDREVKDKVTTNLEYVAQWNKIDYEIQYVLNGGTVSAQNPTSYTVETSTFTLNNPTKNGYEFLGWTGTGLSEASTTVTVAQGSTGDRTYTANWQIINYTIDYDLDGGSLSEGQTNPTTYNVETPSFTLNNPSRVGYTFKGWTSTYLSGETVSVTIASGSTGNRSYKANWEAKTGVKYKVEYYLEKLDGTGYDLVEENYLAGRTNQEVSIEQKTFSGFTFDSNNENNVLTGRILGDESLVLKAYYSRNTYQLTLVKTENIESVTGAGNYKFGQSVTINTVVKTEYGYEITFDKWESNNTNLLADQSTSSSTFTMPAGNLSLTAKANKVATIVGYTVEFYYTVNDVYPEIATSVDSTRTGLVGTDAEITNADRIATQPGYEYDEEASNITKAEIKPDGSTVLKVYFKRGIYTLKVKSGANITGISLGDNTSETELTNTYYYGDEITIDATLYSEAGYEITFNNWSSSNTNLMANNETKNLTFTMPAGNLTLTAVANKVALDSNYNIEYYYQENGTYPTTPKTGDVLTRTGKTGQTAVVTSADKEPILSGYIYDSNYEGNIESAEIKADGSAVLKVYFKSQFTVTYKPGEYGVFEDTQYRSLDYGANLPEYTGSKYGSNGYIFDKWVVTSPEGITEVPETVTQNLELTASWKKMDSPVITHTPTVWTNQDVTVTMTVPEGYEEYSIQYRIGDEELWHDYENTFTRPENGDIEGRLILGTNYGDEVTHSITNIDKVNPVLGAENLNINTESVDKAIISIPCTDNLSGIVEYGIKKDTDAGYTVFKCQNSLEKEIVFDEIYENGDYAIYIKDAAGNNSDTEAHITHIGHFMVARIVATPDGYTDLVGTEYETLEEALATSDEAAQHGNVKIEIIHNIANEANTILEGRDYTINLNSYYVNNNDGDVTLTVNGKLNIVEEKISLTKSGKVSSQFGTAIYIDLTGEFTLGADDSRYPSINSPVIEGGEYGVQKEIDYTAEKVYDENKEKYYFPEGVFNFYDGKVIGGNSSFSLQRVNDTPTMYDPTVATNPETGNQESILAIVSGIEAVIGKKRYIFLEDAVADANYLIGNSNTQVEIKIVRDIAKDADHKVLIDHTKNIKLDLNGFILTTTANDYVIENYGHLEIYDSSEEKDPETGVVVTAGTGKITSSTKSAIYNGASIVDNEENANVDLTTAVNGGDYYFESRAEGGLISNNTGVHNTTSHSYVVVDLTEKSGLYKCYIDYLISSEGNYDYGYVTIRENANIPEFNDSNGRIVSVSGGTNESQAITNFFGGKKYYIHFGYRKDGSANGGSDCFIIKSIRYEKQETDTSLTITSGTIECSKNGNGTYWATIDNDSNLFINGGTIKSTNSYCYAIRNGVNASMGHIEVNGGKISSSNNDCIRNANYCTLILNKCNIESPNNTAIFTTGIVKTTSENVVIYGYNGIITDTNGETTIENANITARYGGAVKCCNNCSATIKNGTFSADYYAIWCNGNASINVENATIVYGNYGIYCDGAGTIVVDNIDITAVDSNGIPRVQYGIYDGYNANITINDANIYGRYRALQNYRNGTMVVNDGTYRVYENNYTVIGVGECNYDASATFTMNGGHIIGKKYGIYAYNNSRLNIYGGFIEATLDDSRAVECNTRNVINIGKNDGTVSTESPKIKAEGYGIISYYGTLNFYDGVVISKRKELVLYGSIDDVPEGYEIVKENKEDGYTYVTLGIPTYYVAKIAVSDNPDISELDTRYYKLEDGYYYFVTVNSAVEACSETNSSTIELIDDAWVYRKMMVDTAQDITMKFNNKCLYLKGSLDIENNGKLKLTNEGAEEFITNLYLNKGNIIKNNENATFEMDSIQVTNSSPSGYSSNENDYRKIMHNYGKMNIKNSKLSLASWDTYLYAYCIYNESTGTVDLDNTIITTNANYAFVNYGLDKTDDEENVEYSMNVKDCDIQRTGNYTYGFRNLGTGTIEIDNSTVRFHYNSIYNHTSGKVIIKGEDTYIGSIQNRANNGTIEIYDGIVEISENNAIDNYGKLNIYGGTVRNVGSYGFGIYNYSSGDMLLSGEDIVVSSSGSDAIKTEGILTVDSGTIRSTKYCGIWVNSGSAVTNIASNPECGYSAPYIYGQTTGISNTGTLNFGAKDANVNYLPKAYGNTNFGIYNSGTFNFYDGVIDGPNNNSIGGTITTTEEDYIRVIHKGEMEYDNGTVDKYAVAANREISVLEQVQIARVESTGVTYTSLNLAMENTQNTDTITILADVSLNANIATVEIPEGKDITVDLAGYSILASNSKVFENNGTFRIMDSTSYINDENKVIEGKITSANNIIFENNGTLIIDNGTIGMTRGGDYNTYSKMIDNNGNLTINGGTLYVTAQYSEVIRNNADSNTIINDGTLYSTNSYNRIVDISESSLTVNGGKLTVKDSYSYCVLNNSGNVEVTDGELEIAGGSSCYDILNSGTGEVTITGGSIKNGIAISNQGSGHVSIEDDSVITGRVENTNSGIIDITGGSIEGAETAVSNTSTGTININGDDLTEETAIKIKAYNSYNANGVYLTNGTINISGYVEIDCNTNNSSYTERGVLVEGGILNIGNSNELDNRVKIYSSNYGFVNTSSGQLNYYGGVVVAPEACYGFINATLEDYEILQSINDENREVYTVGALDDAVSVGENYYSGIKAALAENTTGTLILHRNLVVPKQKTIQVTSEHDVEIDLNGYNVKLHNVDTSIINDGNLKVTDNSENCNGKIYGFSPIGIRNSGFFEIEKGTILISQLSGNKVIYNTGTGSILISGGTVQNLATYLGTYYTIYSDSTGEIDMTAGSIKVSGYYQSGWYSYSVSSSWGIYAENPMTIDFSGGSLEWVNSGCRNGIYLRNGGSFTMSGDSRICTGTGGTYYDGYGFSSGDGTLDILIKDSANIVNPTSISSSAGGTFTMEGGTVNNVGLGSNCKAYVRGGKIKSISGGTSDSGTSEINVYDGADISNGSGCAISGFNTVNIFGSTINGYVQDPYKEFNMTGGSIVGTSFGLRLNNSIVNAVITDGTITATGGPGILENNGTLTIGEDTGGYPSTTVPSITGSTYGVQNGSGTFNFYDGILKGSTYATSGTVTNTPYLFTVIYSADGTTAILGIEATFEQIATVNGIYYDSMSSALDAAVSVSGTIEMCKDVMLTTPITIPEGKTVTIDLAGHTISGYTEAGNVITNNGTLIIIDSTDEGTNESGITSYNGSAIINNGTLTIGIDDENNYTNAPIIKGTTEPITGTGTLNMYDGTTEIEE